MPTYAVEHQPKTKAGKDTARPWCVLRDGEVEDRYREEATAREVARCLTLYGRRHVPPGAE